MSLHLISDKINLVGGLENVLSEIVPPIILNKSESLFVDYQCLSFMEFRDSLLHATTEGKYKLSHLSFWYRECLIALDQGYV